MIINTEGNVDLGAMNALLLEEVEELTLCVILKKQSAAPIGTTDFHYVWKK